VDGVSEDDRRVRGLAFVDHAFDGERCEGGDARDQYGIDAPATRARPPT
jgi:hypothetical protein